MIVLDTHVLIWVMDDDTNLGAKAKRIIVDAWRDNEVGVSAITPWEIALLVEKGRLRLAREVAEWLDVALTAPGVRLLPIEPAIALDSVRLPGTFHADPADRMIVATARRWAGSLITADAAIVAYGEAGHVDVVDAER